jgi:outer membrane protein assembly factor BamB
LVLIVACVILACQRVGAADWPRFRGPNGAGIALDKDIPVQWRADDGLLWKTPLPGVGNSSPVVWGNRLFVQTTSADNKERRLVCVNTTDGKILWSQAVPGAKGRIHQKNSMASSTPATDGERVYALFWDGADITLFAFDFNGTQLWKRGLGQFTSQHGVGASPMVVGDKVILNNDQDGSAVLLAFDAKTGRIAWEAPRKAFRACYSTPFLLEKPGAAPELIVASTAGVTSYQPQTGTENWHWTWTFDGMALRTVSSPIFSQGLIFANSGDGSGARHTVAIKAGGKGDVTKANLVWENNKRGVPYVPCMLAWGDHIFFVHDKGFAACFEARTGKTIWNERLSDADISASPVLIDGKIYAINEKGTAYVFAAAPTFQLLATNTLGEPVIASPAVADHRLFIRGKNHLFCIGKNGVK